MKNSTTTYCTILIVMLFMLFTNTVNAQDSKIKKVLSDIIAGKNTDAKKLLDVLDSDSRYQSDLYFWYARTLCYKNIALASENNSKDLEEARKSFNKLVEIDKLSEPSPNVKIISELRKDLYEGKNALKDAGNSTQASTAVVSNQTDVQDANKTVSLVVTGQGKTPDEAKQSALRSAIEQAFGAFISSKTEILNDNLVKDEIVSVANGNIQKFEIISEVQIPNGGYATTLNAIVSVTKLTSFVESKGVVAEFKGSLLAANVKQQMLNEQNETKSLTNIVNQCKEILDMSCDFEIIRGEPKQKDGDNNKWAVPLTVNVKFNKNIEQFSQYFLNSVKGLCMSSSEIQQYKALGKETYKINIGNGGIGGETNNIEYLKLLAGEYDNLTYKIVLDTVLYSTDVLSDVIKGFKQITKSGLYDYYHRPYKIIYYEKSTNSSYYFRNMSSVVSIIDLIYYTKHAALNFKITNGIDDINIEKMCAGYWEYRRYYRSDKKLYHFNIIDDKLTPIFNQAYRRSGYDIGNGPWKLTGTSQDHRDGVAGTCEGVYNPIEKYNDRFLYTKREDDELYGAVYRLKFGFLTQADYESAHLASLAVISLYDYKTSDENILTFTFEDVLSISELEKIKEYKINTISKN